MNSHNSNYLVMLLIVCFLRHLGTYNLLYRPFSTSEPDEKYLGKMFSKQSRVSHDMKLKTLLCPCKSRHEQKRLGLYIPRLHIAPGILRTAVDCSFVWNRYDCQGDLAHGLGGVVTVRRVCRWWSMDWRL